MAGNFLKNMQYIFLIYLCLFQHIMHMCDYFHVLNVSFVQMLLVQMLLLQTASSVSPNTISKSNQMHLPNIKSNNGREQK